MESYASEEQRLVAQAVSRIVAKSVGPVAAEVDREGVFPWGPIRELGSAGFLGFGVPAEHGGTGADTSTFVTAVEEIAKGCGSTALAVVAHAAASRGIALAGTDRQKEAFLGGLARGTLLGAFAVHESASGANALAIQTRAEDVGEAYRVNGSKFFLTNAEVADVYLVPARTSPGTGAEGISVLLVEKGTPGVAFGPPDQRMGLRGVSSRELLLRDCLVPRTRLVGEDGKGVGVVAQAIVGFAFFGAAAISLGLAQAALETAIQHARERTVAGQAIGAHQGVQFLIADMATRLDAARALVYGASRAADSGAAVRTLAASKAKLFASETALEVTDKALQVLGGHGYTRDYPVERCYRDARGLTLHFKTSELLRCDIGKAVLGP
jgi:butyryl-CoA dehydrogenase